MEEKDIYQAKRGDTKKWVTGNLFRTTKWANILVVTDEKNADTVYYDQYAVLPDTVRQSTGLPDRKGNTIFDGDILLMLYTDWPSKNDDDPRTLEEYLRDIATVGVVRWNETFARYEFWYGPNLHYSGSLDPGTHGYRQIIGNIWDNKEPLEDLKKKVVLNDE